VWSIGIYAGASPLTLAPATSNPVLTAKQVTDCDAYYVADPFMIHLDGMWRMYFEVLLRSSRAGVIGMARSADARQWEYGKIVLTESFHLAYPQVFAWDGAVYMIPETLGANAVRLYEAIEFPDRFECRANLIEGQWADPTIFRYQERWWLLSCSTPYENRTLHLFHADELRGPWHSHPQNPIVADDRHIARPGGRVQVVNGRLIRFAQDCVPRYGSRLRAVEILELMPERYRETELAESPVLVPQETGWNSVGMHHMDAHRLSEGEWIACVDGDHLTPDPVEPPQRGLSLASRK
jgi:hypothetical protein